MSIASKLTKLETDITNAYDSIENKGGTIPANKNTNNLPDAIDSIPSGGSATLITKTITENKTYNAQEDNADGYSQVTVNVVPSSEYIVTLENLHDSSTDFQNTYINSADGKLINYNGWDSTDFIEIKGQIAVNVPIKEWQYCAVYDENKNFIRTLTDGLNSSLTSNVKYIRFSGSRASMRKLYIYPSVDTTNCIIPTVINEALALGDFNINPETLIQILNNLADRTGQTRYVLTLGAANLEKLTSEQKAIATSKNWTLV
jgi:hypothetical protein